MTELLFSCHGMRQANNGDDLPKGQALKTRLVVQQHPNMGSPARLPLKSYTLC